MQHQLTRYNRRNLNILAISVDEPHHSQRMIQRLGLEFDLLSDPNQNLIKAFHIQNQDTEELAQHAVYLVDTDGVVFYRKVAGRRPVSDELLDAFDAHAGTYPVQDRLQDHPRRNVAYPSNNFQTLIEMASTASLPPTLNAEQMAPVLTLIQSGASSDDVLIAFRNTVKSATAASSSELLLAANWLARQRFIADQMDAITAGIDLQRRLDSLRELETAQADATDTAEQDQLLHRIAAVRGGLVKARANINANASQWKLNYAQGALRGYREVALVR